jgi:hypothetical protein
MENPEGGSFTRNFEAWMEEGSGNKILSLSLYGSCVRRTWRESSSTGDPERYVNEGSRN